jgi:hypothetical protein
MWTFHLLTTHCISMIHLTAKQLRKAADIQEKIQSLQKQLNQILGDELPASSEAAAAPKKRKFTAAARAKMRAAQRARWAKIKGTRTVLKKRKMP